MTDWFGFFDRRSMGFKLTFVFMMVVLMPMLLLGYVSYRVMDARLMKDARERINNGLKAAWTEYYVRGDQMRYGMLQAAAMEEIKGAVARRDYKYLKDMMQRWKQIRPYVDTWMVVTADGRVIARLNSEKRGDTVDLDGLVAAAVETGEAGVSTEILSPEFLKLEGKEFLSRVSMSAPSAQTRAGPADGIRTDEADVMALMVVTPVTGKRGKVVGAIVTSDVLNNDDHIPAAVSYKLPGLYTTISVGGTRVSTNLIDSRGRSINGTTLPKGLIGGVMSGEPIFSDWSITGNTYISTFEPIRNGRGEIIGSLDVGIDKEKLWGIQKENQRVILLVTLIGLVASVVVAIISTTRITRPLKVLKERLGDFGRGDLDAHIEVPASEGTGDEIAMLGRTFNSMMDDVREREIEKVRQMAEIEEKGRELAGLNVELRVRNEEIEVAYEESQSQTEELHAINEELKLLNEDLDRKNVELQKANATIQEEEEEIKKVKDKLRLIYDSIRDYIMLVDYGRNVREANRHCIESFNLSEAFIIGKNLYSLFGMEPMTWDCPVKKSIDTMMPVEHELVLPDSRTLRLRSFPFIESREGSSMAVVYIKDITEQKMLSLKLVQSDKLSSLGELVSGVAHELNNPLTGILCFSELLMDGSHAPAVNDKLRKIHEASQRCKKIIENLLTFARWKRPEKKYEDVNRVIRRCAELREYQLKVDNIGLDLDLAADIPKTMIDENQIHQVFLNLINNARDAIKEKGERGRITVRSVLEKDTITVRVEDTGAGLPEEVAARIFDPFFTTKGVGKGTGLGLSISYGIINEHKGHIYAQSMPGKGTAFIVELPVVEEGSISAAGAQGVSARPAAADAPQAPHRVDAEGLRALILDDEAIVLDLLDEALGAMGFTVERFEEGEEAIKRLEKEDYDVIISDIKMPGLDGKGFYEKLRDVKPGLLHRVVFISGDTVSKKTRAFLVETGCLYLKKPFTVAQLNEIVSKLIV